jgi:hypothetical protein
MLRFSYHCIKKISNKKRRNHKNKSKQKNILVPKSTITMPAEVFKTVALLMGDKCKPRPDKKYTINCVRGVGEILTVNRREATCQIMDTTSLTETAHYKPAASRQ